MQKLKISPGQAPGRNVAGILAVILLVSILFTFKKVAETVVEVLSNATGGKINPPVELFQMTAANIGLVAAGLLVFLVGAVIILPVVKWAFLIAGVAMVAVGVFNLYRTFTGKPAGSPLPESAISKK